MRSPSYLLVRNVTSAPRDSRIAFEEQFPEIAYASILNLRRECKQLRWTLAEVAPSRAHFSGGLSPYPGELWCRVICRACS